jgi:RNA polymerase sigma factor (sigma-70 family)
LDTYGLKVTVDQEVTEDCIQDLFLVLWNSRERVSYVQSAKAYLFKSFRGRLFKQLKKTKKYSLFTRTFVSQENYIEFSAEELLIQGQLSEEQQQSVIQALNKLSDRQREIIYLRFYKDLSYEEIGEILPLSYQSIRNCVYEAVKNLKKHLAFSLLLLAVIIKYGI